MKADFVSLKWSWQAMIPFKNVCIDSYIPVYYYKCFFIRKKKPQYFFWWVTSLKIQPVLQDKPAILVINHANLSKGQKTPRGLYLSIMASKHLNVSICSKMSRFISSLTRYILENWFLFSGQLLLTGVEGLHLSVHFLFDWSYTRLPRRRDSGTSLFFFSKN